MILIILATAIAFAAFSTAIIATIVSEWRHGREGLALFGFSMYLALLLLILGTILEASNAN